MGLEHGVSVISVCSNVITVKIQGGFNLEGILAFHKKMISIVEGFQAEKFKILIDFLDADGATADALNEANKFNIWLNNKNLVAKAVVINSPALSEIFFSRAPAQKLQNIKCFDNRAEGYEWLKLQL